MWCVVVRGKSYSNDFHRQNSYTCFHIHGCFSHVRWNFDMWGCQYVTVCGGAREKMTFELGGNIYGEYIYSTNIVMCVVYGMYGMIISKI